jgi:hypothetical protein
MYAALVMALVVEDDLVVAQLGHCRMYRVMHKAVEHSTLRSTS